MLRIEAVVVEFLSDRSKMSARKKSVMRGSVVLFSNPRHHGDVSNQHMVNHDGHRRRRERIEVTGASPCPAPGMVTPFLSNVHNCSQRSKARAYHESKSVVNGMFITRNAEVFCLFDRFQHIRPVSAKQAGLNSRSSEMPEVCPAHGSLCVTN